MIHTRWKELGLEDLILLIWVDSWNWEIRASSSDSKLWEITEIWLSFLISNFANFFEIYFIKSGSLFNFIILGNSNGLKIGLDGSISGCLLVGIIGFVLLNLSNWLAIVFNIWLVLLFCWIILFISLLVFSLQINLNGEAVIDWFLWINFIASNGGCTDVIVCAELVYHPLYIIGLIYFENG